MKDKFPVIKLMTKGDFFLIIGIIILVCVLFIGPLISSDSLYAEIYCQSESVHTVRFEDVTEEYTVDVSNCTVRIEKDGISFLESDCPDQLCVKSPKLSKSGDTMACVPEKVVVVIRSDKRNFDAVSY